jgi:hypothetical protein
MLENDPYFKANNVIRKMQGEEAAKSFNGVSWGISD